MKGFNPIVDSTGKITGYKTEAGADTVFPFSCGFTIPNITVSGSCAGYKNTTGSIASSFKLNVEKYSKISLGTVSGYASLSIDGGTGKRIYSGNSFDISGATEIAISTSGSGSSSQDQGGWCTSNYSVILNNVSIT